MDLVEQGLELLLESLVLGTLIEFAYKVATRFEDIETEFKSGSAQILYRCYLVISLNQYSSYNNCSPYYQHGLGN
jgi:hypothetical protein